MDWGLILSLVMLVIVIGLVALLIGSDESGFDDGDLWD